MVPRPQKLNSANAYRLPFEIWALVAGGFSVALGYGVVAPVIPQYASAFGVNAFAASAIVSAFALMRFLGAPLAGRVVNRFGERPIYSTGILIVALSTGACALAMNYPQLLVLRGLGGIGSAMFSIASTGLMIKLSPVESRARVASVNASGFLLGMLLGPVLGGIVAGFGLRAPFVFYFFTLVIAAGVVWFALRKSKIINQVDRKEHAPPMPLREAFSLSQYRAQLFSVFASGWSSTGVRVSVIPLFVVAAYDGGASAAAWSLAAYAAGNAIFIFPSGKWNDTVGRKPLLIIGMVVTVISYIALPFSPTLMVVLVVMMVAGAGSALVNPGQQAVLADVIGRRSGGNVVATSSMSSDLGGVLGPLIAGALVDIAGYGWAFGVTAGLLAVSAVIWAFVPDSRKLAAARPKEIS